MIFARKVRTELLEHPIDDALGSAINEDHIIG